MHTPEFSVILPTRGDSPRMRAALQSALAGPCSVELLLIHDRLPGEPALEGLPEAVRLLEAAEPGPSGARNTGLQAAGGSFLAFLDDDDTWLPEHLPRAREILERYPEALGCAAGAYLWEDTSPDGDAEVPRAREHLATFAPGLPEGPIPMRSMLLGNPIRTPTMVLRRDRLQATDRFCPDLPVMEDYDLWLRLARRGPLVYDPRPCALIRRRLRSTSRNRRRMAEGALRALSGVSDEEFRSAGLSTREVERRFGRLWHDLAYACLVDDDTVRARAALREAMARRPWYWKNRLYVLAGSLPAFLRRPLFARGRRTAQESVGRRLP